jgi:hypothetical protein
MAATGVATLERKEDGNGNGNGHYLYLVGLAGG